MKKFLRLFPKVIFSVCCTFIVVSCSSMNQNQPQKIMSVPNKTVSSVQLLVDGKDTFKRVPVKVEPTGEAWVPVQEAMEILNFKSQFVDENQVIRFGYTDPLYTIRVGDQTAIAGEEKRFLPQPPQYLDNQVYMTTGALSTLLNTEVTWSEKHNEIHVDSITLEEAGDGATTQSVSSVNGADVVNFAESFLGVPYEFGAGPYSQTKRFDCSSFTKYVYNHFGVEIPRSSRGQSDVGRRVNIDDLQPGDLLFFYTPGRYQSNRIVGHVGMYAGDGEIIHTYGSPGVTKSKLKGYWEGRILFAKRM